MLDLRLEYAGGGQFRCGSKMDFDLCNAALVAGERVRAKVSKVRSVRQNDFFHALIQAAHENQRGGPDCPTWLHLKSWLLIEVGHCDEVRIATPGMTETAVRALVPGIVAALKQRVDNIGVFYDRRGAALIMRFAKSVSFRAVTSDDMKEIVDKVTAIICTTIVPGLDPETIFNMAKAT